MEHSTPMETNDMREGIIWKKDRLDIHLTYSGVEEAACPTTGSNCVTPEPQAMGDLSYD